MITYLDDAIKTNHKDASDMILFFKSYINILSLFCQDGNGMFYAIIIIIIIRKINKIFIGWHCRLGKMCYNNIRK